MPVQEIQPQFRASDGKMFTDKAEAVRHDSLVEAHREYLEALEKYARRLAVTVKTADGKFFEFSFDDYYYILEPYKTMPSMVRVAFYGWNVELDEYDDEGVRIRLESNGTRQSYEIRKLWVDKRKADLALVEAQKAWLATRAAELAEDLAKLG